ncbi:MAG: hypothetical protein R2867_15085 [Caldilineaceae bacterium]
MLGLALFAARHRHRLPFPNDERFHTVPQLAPGEACPGRAEQCGGGFRQALGRRCARRRSACTA